MEEKLFDQIWDFSSVEKIPYDLFLSYSAIYRFIPFNEEEMPMAAVKLFNLNLHSKNYIGKLN
ncbi:unnamed protein product [Acanthoscelides obtectus]|uniref:Uncharacterized protein n=1 Tax=Acanthoscelides obtectus TaxID=200917 RepID=A0A9P0MBY5_ACAOB|nr:unnamed protein product [Acanthoscelides obtectus]CAK1649143.1 hypothetical protein AOBTE_LOCUS16071 [Acanthoscelides obtectus]